jgi:hypothetical protein
MLAGVCEIKISGFSFGAGEFLKTSNLKPHLVWGRGELVPSETAPRPDAGFLVAISGRAGEPLAFHLKEATRFLAIQEPELNRAVRCGAEELRLILHLNQAGPLHLVLPPKLLLLAGRLDIGIEITGQPG